MNPTNEGASNATPSRQKGGQAHDEAERFLTLLDPDAKRFTFQTFDDDVDRKDTRLVRVIHGSLTENFELLCSLNDQGAGVFVTVNETNFTGRKATDIVRVRALFSDLDGVPRPENFLTPSIEVETSEERWHLYYKVTDVALDEFSAKQKGLIARLGSDPSVHDLSRVMRLPGFLHQKGEPRLVRVTGSSGAVYTSDQFPDAPKPNSDVPEHLKDYKSTGVGAESFGLPGRTNDELIALLEASRTKGKWHDSMMRATATMIGRGWSDLQIRLACAPYCQDEYKDVDLVPMIEGARKKFKKPNEERGPNDDEIERLAMLSTLEYDQQRKEAAKSLDVRTKVLDGMVAAARQRQEDAAEVVTEAGDAIVTKINADHALVLSGNKASIMKFESATKFRLLQVGAFRQWFSNQSIAVGKKVTTVGAYWLGHPQRRQYEGIEFEPGGGRPGYYNLWRGFTVQPKKGDCSKFLAHVKDNAARGDEETYKWMIGWWAQIFQQPTVKMETAQVLRGALGSGKTIIGRIIGSLLGDHYLAVASPRYITGQFNSHMASLLVLHADEAFWAGDKKSEGSLKDLVTGTHHMLEFKTVDPIRVKNYVRLFVCGNPNWLIPAGFKERRWAVFDMGEDQMQDHPYFAAIDHEMDNGGREALLHYLLNFDL